MAMSFKFGQLIQDGKIILVDKLMAGGTVFHKHNLSSDARFLSMGLVCSTSKGSGQPAHTHSLIRAFASRLNIL